MSLSGLLNCGIATAENPNIIPVFIVPRFAIKAATTWKESSFYSTLTTQEIYLLARQIDDIHLLGHENSLITIQVAYLTGSNLSIPNLS